MTDDQIIRTLKELIRMNEEILKEWVASGKHTDWFETYNNGQINALQMVSVWIKTMEEEKK